MSGMSAAKGLPMALMVCRGVGDVMWHLPTFRAMAERSPQGQISLAIRPSAQARDLLKAESRIACVIDLPQAYPDASQLLAYVRIFMREKPSSIWVMERATVPSLAAFLAGVPERRGYGMGSRKQELWLNAGPNMPRNTRKLHRIDKLNAFDAVHGLNVTREVNLALDPRTVAEVTARLAACPRPWVVFGVGASEPWRLWPLERFADVAAQLHDRIGTLFWLGGPSEAKAVQTALAGREDQPASAMWFDRPLHEGAALMSLADVFVGPDSGPMNVAAAVGTPAIGLYGPSPLLTYSRHLHAAVSPDGTMEGLTAPQVAESLLPFLQSAKKAS
jgi:heptosyltransferase-2